MPQDFHTLQLIKKVALAKDTFTFTFSTAGKNFHFLPGQFVTARIGNETRDFSIASSPTEGDVLSIVTKEGFSEFKKKLFEKEEGDTVDITNPSGGFILDTNDNAPQVFIAGGIGITPFYSMLKFSSDKKLDKLLTLLVSFSTVEDMIFYEELTAIQKNYPNIQVVFTISSQDVQWKGEKGRITQALVQKYIPHVLIPNYYIVGKVEMVDDMYDMLQTLNVPSDHIKIEYFTGY